MERLHKHLARAGIASRRAAEELILAGRVLVNGTKATLGQKVSEHDQVMVDGQLVDLTSSEKVTFALYKPRGYVTTASDEYGRKNVLEAMPSIAGLHPVGRLDRHSEGLLLLSTDGQLTQTLTHPRFGHEKAYRVWTTHDPHPDDLLSLQDGIELDDGLAHAVSVAPARDGAFIVLNEGRKRQVRRMFAQIGCPVTRLLRYRVGGLWLGDLDVGEYRQLSQQDIDVLLNPTANHDWDKEWALIQKRWG